MEKTTHEPTDARAAPPATPSSETPSVSGRAGFSAAALPPDIEARVELPLTPSAAATAAPTPISAGKTAASVSGNARQTAAVIAQLQNRDIAEVEVALDSVRAAYRRGDRQVIEEALLDQAALLQALGIKLLKVAGSENILARIQIFTNLSLRAMDQARKSLSVLADMRGAPQQQTNVQVNVGASANELMPRSDG